METINDRSRQQIVAFWHWFAANEAKLRSLYSVGKMRELSSEVNHEIDQIEPELAWELGPGKREPYLLTISSEGNPKLRDLADYIVEQAPEIKGWEFYSSRQPRSAPRVIRLADDNIEFETLNWRFLPLERPELGRLDLLIVDDLLGSSDREVALKAVSIYLDAQLGEDEVEQWIGRIEVKDASEGDRVYPIHELPDYLLWATHREKNPLRRTTQ